MALIVQTAEALPDANSYGSVADFRAYHSARNRLVSDSDSAVEGALVRATDYLDLRFRYVGRRQTPEQTTQWPRTGARDARGDLRGGVPREVTWACFEYALRALASDLLPDVPMDPSGRVVASKSESVGPLSERVDYAGGGHALDLPAYPVADRLLSVAGLVASRSGSIGGGTIGRA